MRRSLIFRVLLRRVLLGIVWLVFFPVASGFAGEGDAIRPFFSASMLYDSNLFRFSDDAEASLSTLGVTEIPSVSMQRYGAGIDADLRKGRQQFRARVAVDKTLFSKFAKLLDNTGRDLNAEWKWQAGNRWSGRLAASHKRVLAPYTSNTSNAIESNLRTDDQQVFQADYWFHPDWRARASLSHTSASYSAQKTRDNTRDNATFGLYRLGQSIESLGVEIFNIDGSFDSNGARDFREQGLRLVGAWNFSGKTRLNGRLGYMQRSRDAVAASDFSGPEWRFEARWQPTGKIQVEGAFFRDLRTNDEVGTDYEVADGIKLTASMAITPKTRLIGEVSREHVEYQGIVRKDKGTDVGISASYEAWRGGDISVGVRHSKRESPIARREFDSNSVFISANLKF